MKNHVLRWSLVVAATLIALNLWVIIGLTSGEEALEQAGPKVRSEKSMRMANQGHPDLFLEYHQLIRQNSSGKAYPLNYQIEELNKARAARKQTARQLPWIERGPANVGGRTRALVIDVVDPSHNTWFAGSAGGGIWHTTNAGQSWRVLTDNMPNLAVSALDQSISNPDVLYAGTGEGFGSVDAIAGAGIFKTVDHGETWTQLESTVTPDYTAVNRLIVDPEDENVVVAVTNTGIFRTSDGGTSWMQVYEGRGRVQDIRHRPDDFSVQYAGVNSCCILKSTDAGQTWSVNYDVFYNPGARVELAIAPSNPDWVYAAVEVPNSDIGGDIYLTTDGGASWNLASDPQGSTNNWMLTQGWYDNAIAVHPFAPDTVFVGGIRLWKTSLVGSSTTSGGAPTAFNLNNTESFLDFINFTGGSHFGGRVDIGTVASQLLNVTEDDMTSVEIRFGPGKSQMAHRFSVLANAGSNNDGGAGIAYAEYIYEDYVEVPFEVWDTDNNEQLMVSFRDQADDGIYNLINNSLSGPGDVQSREYIFIHRLPYDENTPATQVAQNGGAAQKTIYFMWPILTEGGVWNPESLPESQLAIQFSRFNARVREQALFSQSLRSNELIHVDHHNITIIPVDQETNHFKIFNANDGGVYYSEDSGQHWESTLNGYITTQFYDADKRPGVNDYIAGAQDNGTWRSLFEPTVESPWRFLAGGDGFDVFWHSEDNNKAIYSYQFNNFISTNNGGFQSSNATEGLDDLGGASENAPFLTSLGWSKSRPDVLFAIGRSGIWRSDDFALNWTLAQAIPDAAWGFRVSAGCRVRVSIANPDYVWAGCRMDAPGGTHSLHLSTNGGQTFSPVSNPTDLQDDTFISGLATHPNIASNAYVMLSTPGAPKIYHTTDFGETWTDISGFAGSTDGASTNGFPDVAVNDLLVLPNKPSELWAATEIGIFSSTDSGQAWAYADNGLPAVSVWRLRYFEDQVIAATHGRGLWTVTEPLEVANESEAVPTRFNLAQNYPNPFNPETTIEFALPAPTNVEIKVFDLNGREVVTLADAHYTAGEHSVNWNADTFASGVYLYQMTAGDFKAVQQMTLVK